MRWIYSIGLAHAAGLLADYTGEMRINLRQLTVLIVLCGCVFPAAAQPATEASEVRDLAARADTLMRLGVAVKGASRSFEEAITVLNAAEQLMAQADLPAAAEAALALEIDVDREDLDHISGVTAGAVAGRFNTVRL